MAGGARERDDSEKSSHVPSLFYVLRGALFIWKNRLLWKYAAAPIGISTVVLGIAYYILYHYFSVALGGFVGHAWYWQILYYAALAIAAILMLVVFFFVFNLVASTIASPFNELLSEKTEKLVKGTFDETPFSFLQLLKDSARGIAHSLRMLATYLVLLIVSLLLWLIPGIGGILCTAAMVLLSAYMLSYEYLGYPMDRRRFSFKDKRMFIRSRFRSVITFGLGCAAVASIPVVNILLIPAAVAGATLLYLDLESPGGSED